MSERICPNCRETVPDWKYCAECGHPLAAQARDDAAPEEPTEVEPAAPAATGPPPPPPARPSGRSAPAPPLDGQLRCPGCGEAVYEHERVCWGCSRRLDAPEEPVERPAPPAVEPTSGAPAQQVAVAAEGDRYVSSAARPQAGRGQEPSPEAMSYAWWAFGLGLLSVFTCGVLGLLGIASVWLGVSAARRDAGPVAIAGAVFGAIGLLMFFAWIIALAVVMPDLLQTSPTTVLMPGLV